LAWSKAEKDGVDSSAPFDDNPSMAKPSKAQIRAFYRTRVVAIQASFEGYTTVQRAKLTAEDCQLPPKKRAALLKKLEKDEKSMEKAFRRALKEIDKT
jgi:hypothetical protein